MGKFYTRNMTKKFIFKLKALLLLLRAKAWYIAARTKSGRLARNGQGLTTSEGICIFEDINSELEKSINDQEGDDHVQAAYRIINEGK